MSLYLTIETATDWGSVAVGEPGRPIAEIVFADRRHAAALMPSVEEVLRVAGGRYADLGGIVVADGPGSFTGLRIGLATAKGMLLGREDLRLLTAPSLMVAAWGARTFWQGPVAALYDALRGDVFAAVYEFSADRVLEHLAPVCVPIGEVAALSPVTPAGAVGDGAAAYAAQVRGWTGREPVGPPAGAPRAMALLELLMLDGAVRTVEDPEAFEPTYGRRAAAQDRWEERHGRALPDSPGS